MKQLGQWVGAILAVPTGLVIHFWFLRLTDHSGIALAHLQDPILALLPTLRLDVLGEIVFAATVLIFAVYHFSRQRSQTKQLLVAVGVLYALRGVLLWLMPIGSPPGAPTDVLQVYPYPNHSYFPGGHVGLISLFGWLSLDRRWRVGFLVMAVLFGFGTMLTKAHYTADMLGGLLLSFAVASFVRWLAQRQRSVVSL